MRFNVMAVAALAAVGALAAAHREARVDAKGVLRWTDGAKEEVALLGVNYYTPFTIDHAEIKRLGLDHRQVIRDDVAHFRRLGLGCIRVHCFERQFSDAEGNLIDNEHLALLDDLIAVCASNGIYTVLTPIAWWGAGHGTPPTAGFSDRYTMQQMTTERAAWKPQARFLEQFVRHVNRHTGRRYGEDPCVLAFECINEPLYPKDTPDAWVTEYINTLVDAVRAGGTTKPVYYNSWQQKNAAAGASRADGVTCVSYPTGLVAGHALQGPQLGRVVASSLNPDAAIAHKSRMVYEFDAADVAESYMFPAMAKMFRAEGVQVASQFQYDPLPLANVNKNWKTHHLNLVYTPGKALSLAVAAEVFARVPRNTPFQPNPTEQRFAPFRVSATENLAELAAADTFIYSNTTTTAPPDVAALRHVWGNGASDAAACEDDGAYFLDRVTDGVWRLQLYPAVFAIADTYTGSEQEKVTVLPGRRRMTVRLPDLGGDFTVRPLAAMERTVAQAADGAFEAEPGDYLLTRGEVRLSPAVLARAEEAAPRFVSPTAKAKPEPLARVALPPQWRAGRSLAIDVDTVFATSVVARVTMNGRHVRDVPLASADGRRYTGTLDGELLADGAIPKISFEVSGSAGTQMFPDRRDPRVGWDFTAAQAVPLVAMPPAKVTVMPPAVATPAPDGGALRLTVGAEPAVAIGCALPFTARETASFDMERGGLRLVANGNADEMMPLEIGFRMKNGQGIGCNVWIRKGRQEIVVPTTEWLWLWGLPSRAAFRWEDVTEVRLLTGDWLWGGADKVRAAQEVDIVSLEWVPLSPALAVRAVGHDTPWSLLDHQEWLALPLWDMPLKRRLTFDGRGRRAVRLEAGPFDGDRDCVSLRAPCDGKTFATLWQPPDGTVTLVVRARAATPQTTAFELVLLDDRNAPWGTNIPLTTEWREIAVPITKLRFFSHWWHEGQPGQHLDISRLSAVNICFGKWLFPSAASDGHVIEIAEIGLLSTTKP